jgi:hypothetical protein
MVQSEISQPVVRLQFYPSSANSYLLRKFVFPEIAWNPDVSLHIDTCQTCLICANVTMSVYWCGRTRIRINTKNPIKDRDLEIMLTSSFWILALQAYLKIQQNLPTSN